MKINRRFVSLSVVLLVLLCYAFTKDKEGASSRLNTQNRLSQEEIEALTAIEKFGGEVQIIGGGAPMYLNRETEMVSPKRLHPDDKPIRFPVHLSDGSRFYKVVLDNTTEIDTVLTHLQRLNDNGRFDLSFIDTQVADAELAHLNELTNIIRLELYNTQVTDAELEQLIGLNSLKNLRLSNTQISDVGLERLEEMSNLEHLFISNTQVTDQGIERLQQALPNCEIHH